MPPVLRALPGAARGGLACRAGRAARAGRGIVAGLGDVQLVAQPELLPLDAPPGIGVIRGGDPGMTGRETVALRLLLPPLDHLPPACGDGPGVVLQQHPAQDVHRRQLAQPRRRGGVVDRFQQRVPVAGAGDGQLIAPGLGLRGPPRRHRSAVAAVPVRHADPLRQPVRVRGGQRLQRRAHALASQLQPVQRRHRRDHVRGIGALLAARLDQAPGRQLRQQRIQRHLLQPRIGYPGAELGQHRVIKARVVQGQPQQVLPVDPGPHRLSRLPVGQPLRPLPGSPGALLHRGRVGLGRGAGISPGPFPQTALRTRRANYSAPGSPRDHAVRRLSFWGLSRGWGWCLPGRGTGIPALFPG